MKKIKVMSVFGTRPEAIKMAPLVQTLAQRPVFESICCLTGQHREMLDSVMQIFRLTAQYDLNIMQKQQTLSSITTRALLGMEQALQEAQPDLVLVHGDTSTTFAGALAAFYQKVPVGHVEAGLAEIVRTKFPEAEVLMGTSTAGIAHAAITATILDLPMGYVRSGSKDISTGGSCIEVVEALREAGAEVLGVASIFTYGMQKGLDRMREANVTNYSLSNLDALVEVAAEEGYIKPEDKARLIAFRNNPSDESWMQ